MFSKLKKSPSISLVIPTYNDSKSIYKLYRDSVSILKKISTNYEIIISDDCSQDDTFEILKNIKKLDKRVKIYRNLKNLGHGQNFKKLYYFATKDLIFLLPGNGQINPIQILKLLPHTKEYDMVIGLRQKGQMSIIRKLQTKIYNLLINLLYGLNLKDVDSIKLIRKSSLNQIELISKSAFTEAELCYKFVENGFKLVEVPITNIIGPSRGGGKLKIILPTVFELFYLRFKI